MLFRSLESAALEDVLRTADAVVLVTAHPGVDYGQVLAESSLLIDLRGVTSGQHAANVVRL